MKRPATAAVVLAAALALPMVAQESGKSANGDFQANGSAIQFNARVQNNGNTVGQMVFSTAADFGEQDVDGGGDANPGGEATLGISADFDCLVISGNRAVMSGPVTNASVSGYNGLRVLLVVEDGGEGGKKAGDRFALGMYRAGSITWIASDAELEFDPGVGLSWFASDFDNQDDTPVPINAANAASGSPVTCNTFPVGGYDLQDLPHGSGNIQVKP